MPTKCRLIEPTGIILLYLRRYSGDGCPANNGSYHNAQLLISESIPFGEDGIVHMVPPDQEEQIRLKYENGWPDKCACGYHFSEEDRKQIFRDVEYQDEQGSRFGLKDAQPGSMWFCRWRQKNFPSSTGPDGKSLIVKLPNGHEWCIDGRASNCDSPCKNCGEAFNKHNAALPCKDYVDARPHKCWVRHGVPPNLHVDKNGITCKAGAGSIWSGNYHGFLHHGQLS